MKLHNFFIPQKIDGLGNFTVTDSALLNQWRHVLRFNTGSSVVVFDNSGFEYLAQFTELTYLKAVFTIIEKRKNLFAPKKEISLFLSLIKTDRFEWALEKGTELGVSRFVPVIAKHSVAKKINLSRAEKILKESAEQSGRGVLPNISEAVSFEEAVSSVSSETGIFFDPSGSPFKDALSAVPDSVSLFIGPEGGWSSQEMELARAKNIPIFSLGTQILRAETAAVAVSTLFLL